MAFCNRQKEPVFFFFLESIDNFKDFVLEKSGTKEKIPTPQMQQTLPSSHKQTKANKQTNTLQAGDMEF